MALAYLGTTDGSHVNGYITESQNVLARRPRFWSASVNDPADPLANAADTETFGDRFFYGTDTIARHGTVWAGFHCAKTTACPGRRIGVVGRLTNLTIRHSLRDLADLHARNVDRVNAN